MSMLPGFAPTSHAPRAGARDTRRRPRVLLARLSVRTSAQGRAYLTSWIGAARLVAFAGEPDKYGNETWDLFVAEPEPKPEG